MLAFSVEGWGGAQSVLSCLTGFCRGLALSSVLASRGVFFVFLHMSQLARRLLAADLARAVELRPRLDHQLPDHDVAVDPSAGGNLQALGIDAAVELPADQDSAGLDFALDAALFPDGNLGIRTHCAFQAAVDMQVIAQGKVADQL